jgi:hypothetical protein
MRLPICQCPGVGLLFPPRRRGNPTTAANSAGNRRTGRTGEPACRQEGQPEVCGKLQAEGRSEYRTGILRDRRVDEDQGGSRDSPRRTERFATADREVGHRQIERSAGGQVVRPTPVIRENHTAVGLVSTADPDGVGSPARHRTELGTPRGLKLRRKLPRGFPFDCERGRPPSDPRHLTVLLGELGGTTPSDPPPSDGPPR